MKYLKDYKIFENIQRGEKLLKDNNITDLSVYYKLVDKMKEEGLSNYVGFITQLLMSEFNNNFKYFTNTYIKDIITNLKEIKNLKINVDNIDIKYLSGLNAYLYDYKIESDVNKFINKYLPSYLRKEVTKENKKDLEKLIIKIRNISNSDIELYLNT